jgi:predicted XRE-type DNA-binding protein
MDVTTRWTLAGKGLGSDGILNSWKSVGVMCCHANAEELTVKAQLAVKLNEIITMRHLTQNDVARITGLKQPKVSLNRRYKLQNISLERLMQALVALDQRVEIRVSSAEQSKSSGITVAA